MSSKDLIACSPLSLSASLPNLDAYIHWVYQVPMLSEEEERVLTKDLHDNGDLEAAKKLILAHLRCVVKIARGYMGYGLPLADLIQEGNVGLMKAVRRFDPAYGVRLVTLAVYWIKSEIHDFVVKNWRIVKIATTKSQRKLFFNLRSYKKKLGAWFSQDEKAHIASELNVSEEEVARMEQRLHAVDFSFDPPEEEEFSHPMHYLEDHSLNPARLIEIRDSQLKEEHSLTVAIQKLDERSRDIISSRWLSEPKATLHDLANKYDLSAERVRQLEKNAMKKMQAFLSVE